MKCRLGVKGTHSPSVERGQSLVEFALVLPIILMLLMGIVDIGFTIHAKVQVVGACYEGARRGSLFSGNVNEYFWQNDTARESAVRAAVSSSMGLLDISNPQNFILTSDVQISYVPTIPSNSTRTGDEMAVTVSYKQPVWFSLFTGINNSRLKVSNTTRIKIQ